MVRRCLIWFVVFAVSLPTLCVGATPAEKAVTAKVDKLLAASWEMNEIQPAPPASDAEFLRRAWLDLCGIIPPINDADGISGIYGFLQNDSPDKREQLIEALLNKPRHATHFANVWKNVMLPPEVNVLRFGGGNGFEGWLRGHFADNTPYDDVVREILTATGTANQPGPALYYSALQLKPEDLAASTSRIFLGTQIQCAQCHDHPFDHWKREDFWGYAAFFARLQQNPRAGQVMLQVNETDDGEVMIPGTEKAVLPRFLKGDVSSDEGNAGRRERLADWLTSAENEWFSRATVNRVWGLLFGRGIVDPVDDIGSHNPPSHPELLDMLSRDFAQSGFDVNRLIRILTMTRAWQLSSESTPDEHADVMFARMAIKSLTAEQLYDCLAEAMHRREGVGPAQNRVFAARGINPNRAAFLAKFRAPTQGATEYEAGIPQALTLMNGADVRQATDLSESDLLVSLQAPFFTNQRRVEVLFLSTLSRLPSEAERDKFLEYVEQGGTTNDSRAALSDVLWALLNSAEFILNH